MAFGGFRSDHAGIKFSVRLLTMVFFRNLPILAMEIIPRIVHLVKSKGCSMRILLFLLSLVPLFAFAQSWQLVHETNHYYKLYDVGFSDQYQGYAGGSNGYMIKTRDGGETWQQLPFFTNTDINDIEIVGMDTVYVGTWIDGEVWRSDDGGMTWTEITPVIDSRFIDLH
ncbi:MAG: hypothetical protein RL266_2156, partial [Bacteroidota bacterium]